MTDLTAENSPAAKTLGAVVDVCLSRSLPERSRGGIAGGSTRRQH